MSWSYSGNPDNSAIDKYRFMLGDTDEKHPLMQNEEIQFIINESNGNENNILYMLFSHAATIFARDIKRTLGPQHEDPTDRLEYFKSKAEEYHAKLIASGLSIPPYASPKIFMKGMDNNPPVVRYGRRHYVR
jgi:hypothetical protein